VASWLVRSSPDGAVRVRALARGHCVEFLGKTLKAGVHLKAVFQPGIKLLMQISRLRFKQ